jgi:hypothetical protein
MHPLLFAAARTAKERVVTNIIKMEKALKLLQGLLQLLYSPSLL